MTSPTTIKRESGDTGKGPRLQRLRAIQYMLEKMREKDNIAICAATELWDDVFHKTVKADDSVEHIVEGDKNYDPESSFTFHSVEVTNTLVAFIDCWINNQFSNTLYFCFYTNVRYGKEKKIKSMKLPLPKKAIISCLLNKDYTDNNLLPYVTQKLIDTYEEQYTGRKDTGYLETIRLWTNVNWLEFLERIQWQFQQQDDKELETHLLQLIKESNPYPTKLDGQENLVLMSLEIEFERKQDKKDFFARIVTASDVKLKYLEVANNVVKRSDPVFKLWEALPKPFDKRNLAAKIHSVCSSYKPKELGRLARKVCEAKEELSRVDSKERGSYQYRVYDACDKKMEQLLEQHTSDEIASNEIDHWIDELVAYAHNKLEERSKDYDYVFTNKETLRNVVLDLFDTCYLAFDEGETNGE